MSDLGSATKSLVDSSPSLSAHLEHQDDRTHLPGGKSVDEENVARYLVTLLYINVLCAVNGQGSNQSGDWSSTNSKFTKYLLSTQM